MRRLCLILIYLFLVQKQPLNNHFNSASIVPNNFFKKSESDTIFGIDISYHQKSIKWSSINGVDFVFIKATEGVSIQDLKFSENWDSAKRRGLIRGAYHFYRPYVGAKEQFINFKKMVRLKSGDLPPVLDAEIESRNPKKLKNDYKIWLNLVEKHYGVVPIIYCSSSFYRKYFKEPYFKRYTFWIANYVTNDINKVHNNWHFWQHTCFGKVDGISTHVDKNIFNGDFESLVSLCKK